MDLTSKQQSEILFLINARKLYAREKMENALASHDDESREYWEHEYEHYLQFGLEFVIEMNDRSAVQS